MAKVTPVLWTSKKNSKGLCPIYLRITDTDKTRYKSLREYVRETQWNERIGRVRANHDDAEDINAIIAKEIAEAEAEIRRLKMEDEVISADKLKRILSDEAVRDGDFIAFARDVVAGYEKRDQIASHVRLNAIVNKLEGYQKRLSGSAMLPFSDLTTEYLRKYRDYLASHHKNKPNTIAKDLKGIRTILYTAIREGIFPQSRNPFFNITISEKPAKKERLSMKEIEKLENLELEEGSSMWHARNAFLFSLYMSGIRFGDLVRLKWSHVRMIDGEPRLHYKMGKTQDAADLLIIPPAQRILDVYKDRKGYIFPFLDSYEIKSRSDFIKAKSSQNVLINGELKDIQAKAEIDTPISFHVSRHSFADIARRNGWTTYDISKALQHSSLKQTEAYLASFDNESLDKKRTTLFGGAQ